MPGPMDASQREVVCNTYDGNPLVHGADTLFRTCAAQRVSQYGTGAAYLTKCEKPGWTLGADCDLSALRSILSTGSPLPASSFRWVYQAVAPDVHLGSDSGGTDVATAFQQSVDTAKSKSR